MACNKCTDGYIITQPFGLKVKCNCIIESPIKEEKNYPDKPVYKVTQAHKEMAVYKKIIPESRINDEFDENFIRARVVDICRYQDCVVVDFQKYISTLNDILVGISTGVMPNKSYLIGSPNGFGKTTFANTCIKRLDAMGKNVVPYISLFELGDIKVEHEKKVLGILRNNKKLVESSDSPENDIEYTWNDYIKSDVLFVYFTTLDNKKIESKVLKTLVDIRATKGLPTIAFTSIALKAYLSDRESKEFIWDDILAYNDNSASYDRLLHRSCYKKYSSPVQAQQGKDY